MNVFNHITREERAKEGKVRRNRIEGQQIGAVTKLQKDTGTVSTLVFLLLLSLKNVPVFQPE